MEVIRCYYIPNPNIGPNPKKTHAALAAINKENGNRGASIKEIAERCRLPLPTIAKEMRWGKKGNAGYEVVKKLKNGKYRHTDRYDPEGQKSTH